MTKELREQLANNGKNMNIYIYETVLSCKNKSQMRSGHFKMKELSYQ